MTPFRNSRFCTATAGGSRRRSAGTSHLAGHLIAMVAAIGALLATGWQVARTLDSPLLAVVISGMLLLIAISVRGIGQSGRR